MERLKKCLMCFEEEKEYLFVGEENDVELTEIEDLSSFKSLGRNETLIKILSETDKIIKEINTIKEYIKKTYDATTNKIKFDEKKLIKFSVVFAGISNYAFQYAEKTQEDIREELTQIENIICQLEADSEKNENLSNLHTLQYSKKMIEEELKTVFFDSYIRYLNLCINHLENIRELVDVWFNIDKNNTKKDSVKRLFDAFYMKFDSLNGMELPKSQWLFVYKNKKKLYLLKKFAIDFSLDINSEEYNLVFLQQYEASNIEEILNVLFYQMINSKVLIKKCEVCNKYFIPLNRTDEKYCNRKSPEDRTKTCKEYGAIKTYQEKLKKDEAMNLYRKIYMQKQMKAKRYHYSPKYKDDFDNFREEAKQWKEKIKKRTASELDYIEWLKEQRGGKKDGFNNTNKE